MDYLHDCLVNGVESVSEARLDLRGTPCPVNFIRCRLALEHLPPAGRLQVDLDCGEPEAMVIPSLRETGYQVEIVLKHEAWLRLQVTHGKT
ncbi:sulfurtransferase TusA family protein [cyanobiont of Ornithocercus magnificus]|nr:sulfurtransferase TusA family protein [cyanobiont of Ornithocercus magnificus]